MIIKSMFKKDIERNIKGVIKVGQQDQEDVKQELEEYVVTGEIRKHLAKFYNNYQKGIDGTTDKMGVWISGFFGSGKSHFLKILSYLLENKEINGKHAIDYFEEKIDDNILFSDMKRLSSIPTEVILFNIDSESDFDGKTKEDAILKVFKKVFNVHRGFYGGNYGIADMESKLEEEGVFEDFKNEFEKIKGSKWDERRRSFRFDGDSVIKALVASANMSEETAREWQKNCLNEYKVSIKDFSKEVNRYLSKKPKNFHLVFLVDEVGQYIGDDTKLMVNLQTMAEDLGTACHGKVWVMVTSQEAIDQVAGKIKGDDFSKIQGRFDTRLSLTSISANEVIKKRILEKNSTAEEKLKLIYAEKSAILNNLITFKDATNDYESYADAEEFASVYPFVPYQFKLLQNVFEQVRKHGSAGKHLSEGERSLLSAFKESADKVKDDDEGVLVPFYSFYETISEFLNPVITRVIGSAEINSSLKKDYFNINVLKVLFMMKYVGNIPANIENIATLMVTNIEEDKLKLKEKIKKSLLLLQLEMLIQKNGEEYIFLTDDEQDVNKEIKDIKIDNQTIMKHLRDSIFNGIYGDRRFRYSANYDFEFNKKMDDKTHGTQTAAIGLHIISSYSDMYDRDDQSISILQQQSNEVLVKLYDNGTYIDELKEVLQILEYIKTKHTANLPQTIVDIINGKSRESRERQKRVEVYIEEAIREATFYINGEKKTIPGSNAKEKLDNALKQQVDASYWKLSYIDKFYKTTSEVDRILTDNQVSAIDMTSNELAIKEVISHIDLEDSMNKQIRVKLIMDKFKSVPYGWNELDIAAIIATLLKDQKIRLRYGSRYLEDNTGNIGATLIKPSENDNILVEKRVKIDATLLRSVKISCRELWGNSDIPDDEDGIARYIKDRISDEKLYISNFRVKYAEGKYPGEALLDKGLEYLGKFDYLKDNKEIFDLLVESDFESDFVLWKDHMHLIETFFKSQKDIYDKGKMAYSLFDKNKYYLDNQELQKVFDDLGKIINDPTPYKEIKNIPELADIIISRIKIVAEKTRVELKEQIDTDLGYIRQLASGNDKAEESVAPAINDFEGLVKKAETNDDISYIDGLKRQSELIRSQYERLINQIIGNSKVPEDDEPEGVYHGRPVKKMKYKDLFEVSQVKTASDVDALIKNISKKLKLQVKNSDIEFTE